MLAIAALLARDAAGAYLIPSWTAILLQVPLPAMWCFRHFSARPATAAVSTFDRILTLVMMLSALGVGIVARSVDAYFVLTTTYIAAMLLLEYLSGVFQQLERLRHEPTRLPAIILRPWLSMILIGTVLLALPLSTQSAVPDYRHNFWLHVGHSAHAAVSAACLVGTSTYSFGENYTFFGQAIILTVTQLSGMAFAALGLAIARPFLKRPPSLRGILLTAACLQLAAVAVLFPSWHVSDAATIPQKAWFGLVHATSALWNSGWTLRADGLGAYLGNPMVFATVTILSVAGSLGLPILLDLLSPSHRHPQRDLNARRRGDSEAHRHGDSEAHRHGDSEAPLCSGKPKHDKQQSPPWQRIAPWEASTALILLVTVAGCIFFWETPGVLPQSMVPARPVDFGSGRVSIRDDMPHVSRWTLSVFLATTVRSAGLQSMPLSEGAISWPTFTLLLAMMLLGGSAFGTAGGLRVSTLLLLVMCVFLPRLSWTSHPGGYDARRMLLAGCIRIVLVSLALCGLSVLLLFLTTDGTAYDRTFDATSAVGNVGLSTGFSLHLTVSGRISMMLMMLAGRWIPMVMWLRLASQLAWMTNRPSGRATTRSQGEAT